MTSLNSTSNSNALIVGCGSKFGQTLSITLENRGFTVYGISSNTKSDTVLNVDWQKCFIPTSWEMPSTVTLNAASDDRKF